MGAPSDRGGFARYLQEQARRALARGEVSAARGALRFLRTTDFSGGPAVAEALLALIRDGRSTAEEVAAAAVALVQLEVADDAPPVDPDSA